MLQALAPNLWHVGHRFRAAGLPVFSRMTVVRLRDGRLWLHSPVPLAGDLLAQLTALGEVAYIVAPNKFHHLFAQQAVQAFPTAQLYGPGGLRRKRPDLSNLIALPPTPIPDWADDFDQLLFDGFPAGAETVWFHKASRTLILTDICQWWQGELPLLARFYAMLTGVRDALAVPRTVRWLVKDKAAARRSATRILQWPIERVVVAHNSVIERDAMAQLRRALGSFVD